MAMLLIVNYYQYRSKQYSAAMLQNLHDYDNIVQDVLNYEEFMRHFSSDEQKQLLKYLAPVDSFAPPDRFVQFTS